MPITPTYPGVYIDELPSAVRTIIGVPTSIAAFVGWAPRGPADAFHVTSWDDYQRVFGGLHVDSPMSQAVYQFYQNGGSEAEIVRLAGDGEPATVALTDGPTLKAANPGTWGAGLRVRVDYHTKDPGDSKLYNLTVKDTGTGAVETYLNVSSDVTAPRALANVLASSDLVDVEGDPDKRPKDHADPPGGEDPFTDGHDSGANAWYTQATGGSDEPGIGKDDYLGDLSTTGLYTLRKTDIFNMLCLAGLLGISPASDVNAVQDNALALCGERRAMYIVDPPLDWTSVEDATATHHLTGEATKNAAIYFPNIRALNPVKSGVVEEFPPCGVIAGVWARTDAQRGVWKAPAGTDASLNGIEGLAMKMTDRQNGILNPLGVNCLRTFPVIGSVSWGARTMRGADRLADQWKYVPVRRLALFIEESLYRGTQWVVFEPNDEPLWSSIRMNVGAFMNNLFRQGAFQGRTPQEAYLVKCDATNNPQNDIDRGIVNILVGFAPLKPAEFVIIHIQQLAGQIQV
jgi:uncharacterized protein